MEAFQELSLGVRTIISVDAAKPDVATAKQLACAIFTYLTAMTEFPRSRAELAVQELEGPILSTATTEVPEPGSGQRGVRSSRITSRARR